MAEEKKAQTTEKKTEKKTGVVSSIAPKTAKLTWTLERCKKFAHRYTTEQQWASCHSSSYKAATAHGWVAECLRRTNTTTRKAA